MGCPSPDAEHADYVVSHSEVRYVSFFRASRICRCERIPGRLPHPLAARRGYSVMLNNSGLGPEASPRIRLASVASLLFDGIARLMRLAKDSLTAAAPAVARDNRL